MKNLRLLLMLGALVMYASKVNAQSTDTTNYNYGVWQAWAKPLSKSLYPEIKGRLCNFKWKDLETAPGIFNWALLESEMALNVEGDLPVIFCVYTKEDAPDWLFENGVPKVLERDSAGVVTGYAPYYQDSLYKYFFKRMIDSVQNRVELLPTYIREKIIAVQTAFGSTGDYISYKGIVEPQYQLNSEQFFELFKEFTTYYYEAYQNSNPKIRLLNNPNKTGKDQTDWLMKYAPGGWLKSPAMAKGYLFNFDQDKEAWLFNLLNQPQKGEYVRSRSEITGPNTTAGWWIKAPYKNLFATLTYNVHWGLDWPNETNEIFIDPNYKPALIFFNKYAGKKDPVKSDVAMCALKDALDASDSIRFPASEFGEIYQFNASRYSNIQQAFAGYGALLEDVNAAMASLDLENIEASGFNDVGWRTLSGNFERYLHQIDANETSVGLWNIPSSDTNTIYGRFGRGFELESNKDALYFNIEDLFLNNAPVNGQYEVTIEITYLDKGFGSWQLFYDQLEEENKPSIQLTCNNTGQWLKAAITINDGYFGNRGLRGSDFYIKSTGNENVIFTLVELSRTHEGITDFGLYALSEPAFDTICVNSTSFPKSFVLAGSYLDSSDIILHAKEGFQFAKDSNDVYTDSIILSNYDNEFYQTIFVKFVPATPKDYTDSFYVTGGGVQDLFIPVKAVAVNSVPALQPIITPVSCFGLKNGAIDLNFSGGTGPFSFKWTSENFFPPGNAVISGLSAGVYNVSIGSFAGCMFDTSFPIIEPEVLGAEISLDPMICKNGTTTLHVNGTGGTLPYDGVGDFMVGPGNQNYTITDANGCIKKGSINVVNGTLFPPAKPGAISSPLADLTSLCGGGEFEFSINPVSTATSYTWSLPPQSEIIASNFDSSQITLKAYPDFLPGNLTVAANNACGTGPAQLKVLTITPGNPGQITGFTSVMPAQTGLVYSVEPVQGMTYEWTVPASATIVSGQSTNSITVNWGVFGGNISVYAKNNCNEISPVSKLNISVISGVINVSATTLPAFEPVCVNGASTAQSFTISANGLDGSPVVIGPVNGFKFSANENGYYSSTFSISNYGSNLNNRNVYVKYYPEVEGAQSVIIPINGGGSNPSGVEAAGTAINSSPVLSAEISGISCIGNQDGAIDLSLSGGTGPFTYFWTGAGITNATAEDLEGLAASNYKVTVTSYLGCTITDTFNVTKPDPLAVTLVADPMECKNGTTIIHVTATGGNLPYYGTGDFSANSGKSSFTVTDANGCESTRSITVSNGTGLPPAKPGIISGREAEAKGLCGTGLFNFSIEPVANATGYSWTTAANSNIYSISNNERAVQIVVDSNFLTGSLSVAATNNCGSSPFQVKQLTAFPANPGIITGPSVIIANQSDLHYSVAPVDGISYNWTLPLSATIDQDLNSSIIATWGKYTGKVKVMAENNCGNSNYTVLDINVTNTAALYTSLPVDFYSVCNQTEKIDSFMLYGVLLDGSDVVIGPANNYSFSTSISDNYDTSLVLTGYAKIINQKVFVKFKPLSTGNYDELVNISGGGFSAIAVNIAGNGVSSSPSIYETIQNASCFGSETGSINLTLTGGSAPFTYKWFKGTDYLGSDENISNLKAGNYSVEVSSLGGCSVSKSFTVSEPEPLEINFQQTLIGDFEKVIISATGGTLPYSGIDTFDLVNGLNIFSITDANGCFVLDSIQFEEGNPLFVNVVKGEINCAGGTAEVTISAEGGVAPYTGTGTFIVTAGNYSYTIIDSIGHQKTVDVLVEEPDALQINYSFNPIKCFGDSTFILINAIGGTTPYTGEGLFGVTAGNYSYAVFDAKGCNADTLVVVETPSFLTASSGLIMENDQTMIEVVANGGTEPYSGTGIFTPNNGENTFLISDANGCAATTSTVWEAIEPLKVTAVAGSINCYGATTSVIITAEGGEAPYMGTGTFEVPAGTYQYTILDANNNQEMIEVVVSQPDSLSILADYADIKCNGGKTTINLTGTGGTMPYYGTGSYNVGAGTYNYTIQDKNGCIAAKSITLTEPDKLKITRSPGNILCYGGKVTLEVNATGGVAPYTGTGVFTIGAGTYSKTITDANGCSVTGNATITQPAMIVVTIDSKTDVSCKDGSDGKITVSATGGRAPYSYSLDNINYTLSNTFMGLTSGNYSVYVRDVLGCVKSTNTVIANGTGNCSANFGAKTNLNTKEYEVLEDWIVVKAYPNPTLSSFVITLKTVSNQPVSLIVTDMYGHKMYQTKGSGNATYVFGDDFPSGMYMLRIQQDGQIKTIKLIKGRG